MLWDYGSTADSLTISIHSDNLSEDMSTLSSNDDELLLFVFDLHDSMITGKALISEKFILHKNKLTQTFRFKKSDLPATKESILFLIELDSDETADQIENKIKINCLNMMKAYPENDYPSIQKYLGDDDILGIKTINNLTQNQELHIEFSNIYRMDRYIYTININ